MPDLQPGAYVMAARAANEKENWGPAATQWFVVSDLGLSTISANDGLHVFVRSLGSAKPVAGIALRLVAVNNEFLGRATTEGRGYARFAPGLVRGKAGSAPAVLAAEGQDGDYNFLDLTRPALDLADRSVGGRAPAGPLDVYLTTERGIHRAGEIVHLTALVRDARASAVTGAPLTAIVTRPDGVEQIRFALEDSALGAAYSRLALKVQSGTPPFTWFANGAPVAKVEFGREAFWQPDGRGFFELTVIDGRRQAARARIFLD